MSALSKIKAPARIMAKRIPTLRKIMRRMMYGYRRFLYLIRMTGTKVDEKMIVFESFSGNSYSDTPKAVYEYMCESDGFKDYKFIWIFKQPDRYNDLKKEPRTWIVKYRSYECERYLAKAKYWIFNYRALDHWIPRKEQVYVQCWHGTPLKRLGCDIIKSDNAMNSIGEIRDKYYRDAMRFKYLLSSCQFTTGAFKSAWDLEALGKESTILEVGYPRNDFLVNHKQKDIEKVREKIGLTDTSKKVILYVPTWRDNQHKASLGYTYEINIDFNFLREQLGDEYLILFRAHYLVASSFDFSAYRGFVYDVSKADDINELYIISDMLITDYSSAFFDYAILEMPIIFYMYDLEEYRDKMRGFYLSVDELPGNIVATEEQLIKAIKSCRESINKDRLHEFNKRFNYLHDGQANNRMMESLFGRQV